MTLFFSYYQVLLVLINDRNSFDKNLIPLINWFNLQFLKGFLIIR